MEMKAIQGRKKRCARRGRLLSLFGYLPLRNLHVSSSMLGTRGEGQKDGGRAKKVDREKGGQGGDVRYSFSLSHIGLLSLLPCPEVRERKREREGEKKRSIAASDRGTRKRKRNCLLRCQPMAMPASSPLNIKHKYNVYH